MRKVMKSAVLRGDRRVLLANPSILAEKVSMSFKWVMQMKSKDIRSWMRGIFIPTKVLLHIYSSPE